LVAPIKPQSIEFFSREMFPSQEDKEASDTPSQRKKGFHDRRRAGAFPFQRQPGTAQWNRIGAALGRQRSKVLRPILDQGDFAVLACLRQNRAL
jgi:hypothetical protein